MASAAWRLPPRRGEVVDRADEFSFTWNGKEFSALAGDTIVSALMASGVRVFSRSFKYHRRRGVLTASFIDPGCTVQIGQEPNVRGAHRHVRPGDAVSSQNTWPTLELDVKAANQLLGRFLGPGFYYKTFIRPRRLWPAYEQVLSRFASGGRVAAADATHEYFDKRYAHPDVLVAGGGPAGMAAAVAAAAAGADVLLVEEEYELGGHLRWGDAADLDLLDRLRADVDALPNLEVMTDAVVSGRYDDGWTAVVQRSGVWSRERLVKARVGCLVVAPGLIERPFVFAGNDLPGVMVSTAVLRLTGLHAVRPGTRAVVLAANESGDAAAGRLREVGVEVARVLDARAGETVRRAVGRGGLQAVVCGDGEHIQADLLVTATGWTAPTSLLNMAGDRPRWDPVAARFFPGDGLPAGVIATGGIVGDGSAEELVEHGRQVGELAAARANGERAGDPPVLARAAHPSLFHGPTHGFVDLSEDVTSKDILASAAEGYDSAELAKRFTTATMGPTQGKLEVVNLVAVLAEATGRDIGDVGTTVWRAPYAPVSLGVLAGRTFEPVRFSPMQPWHEQHGAVPLVAGQWIRPEHYGDPVAEVRNVRTNVGLIDVTPLGKLDLRGPDVARLLDLVYVNSWDSLAVGQVRYGVMCAEDGVVLDDGVTGRVSDDHYLMTTTSAGAATVYEWIEEWLQTRRQDLQVHVTPMTSAYASINVAGPRSRELIERLTDDVDVSREAFGYMRVRTGTVAGVPDCVLWRIGFTGELGFELHVPASYGLHAWQTIIDVGRDLGVAPFGVEAQRILRLEKGHLIVGQDTDGLTGAWSAGVERLVHHDKPDFAGKPELLWQEARSPSASRLVALETAEPHLVPAESCQLVSHGDRIVGRVTSSRMSPTLGRTVCLAQLAAPLAVAGTTVTIVLTDGSRTTATVRDTLAFVDPEGVRVRG